MFLSFSREAIAAPEQKTVAVAKNISVVKTIPPTTTTTTTKMKELIFDTL